MGVVVVLVAVLLASPALAAAGPVGGVAASTRTGAIAAGEQARPARGSSRAEELAAMAAAKRTGRRVELAGLRTEIRQVFANPGGTFTAELAAQPVRVLRPDGTWVPVSTALRANTDGSISPAAVPNPLTFSGGGTGPLATLATGGKTLSLSWPARLPAPVLDGDTATYPEVLPGVDLLVGARVSGFVHMLVVKSRAAAANPALRAVRYGLTGKGLALRQRPDGTLAGVDGNDAAVVTSGPALMWDSAAAALADAGPGAARTGARRPAVETPDGVRQRHLGMRLAGGQLEITPDRQMLEDPATVFPVLIDPFFSTANWPWAYADQSNVDRNDGVARVGKNPDGSGLYRSYFNFPIWQMTGKHILRATFTTKLLHSWSCASTPVSLWRTDAIVTRPRTAWAPGLWQHLDERSAHAHKGPDACGNQSDVGMEFSGGLTGLMQTAAVQAWGAVTLGLSAMEASGCCEATTEWWKKFSPGDTYLNFEYNSLPAQPTDLGTANPNMPCVTGAGRPFVNTTTPILKALVNDSDAGQVLDADFRLNLLGQTQVAGLTAASVPPGTVAQVTVPQGVLTDGATYEWFVRAGDRIDWSPWSARCEFTVDRTAPAAMPGVSSSVYPADPNNFNGEVGLAAPFTFDPAGVADAAGYDWSFSTLPVTATGAPMVSVPLGAPVTVLLTPPPPVPEDPTSGGQLVLHVRSVDRAGNRGPVRDYSFLVGSRISPDPHVRSDVNGDGTADAVELYDEGGARSTARVQFGTPGGGFYPPVVAWEGGGFAVSNVRGVVGDFTGDGRTDVALFRSEGGDRVTLWRLVSNGNTLNAPAGPAWDPGVGNWWFLSRMKILAGDFNGDGKDDVAAVYNYDNNQYKFWVWTSTGGGFSAPAMWWDNGVGNADWNKTKWVAGDFNGDGKADLGTFYNYGNAQTKLWFHRSTGSAFLAGEMVWDSGVGNWDWTRLKPVAADFNGDGKTDVAALYVYDFCTWKLWQWNASGSGVSTPAVTGVPQGCSDWNALKPIVGDYTGDGKPDVSHFYRVLDAGVPGIAVWTLPGTGTAFGSEYLAWYSDPGFDWNRLTPLTTSG